MRLIDRLCQAGLVERRPHPRDRRANRLYLTDKGHATLVRLMPLGREITGDMLASMSEADILDLLRKLLLIKRNIRHAAGKREALPTAARRQAAPGVRVMAINVSTMLRSSAPCGPQGALLAHDADGDPAGAGAVVGCLLYLFGGRYVSTDNAYVGAQKVLITPEVSGKVVSIAVVEGQRLSPGDELFAIDPAPYRFAAQEAEARLARIRSEFENLKSTAQSLAKQIELARQSVAANEAEFDRKTSLLNNRISTPADLDRSSMALAASKGLLEQLLQQEATVRNQLLGNLDLADREVSPVRRRRPSRSIAPSATSPTPSCARPSPASPRR